MNIKQLIYLYKTCYNQTSVSVQFVPEQELSVEVGDINGVHVYYVNVLETQQCL